MFILLLASIVNACNYTKCISLSNQKCEGQPTPIKLHLNEYTRELQYFPFAVKLDRCVGSCSTLNDLFNKVCVPNKTEDLNTYVFHVFVKINIVDGLYLIINKVNGYSEEINKSN